MAAPRDRFGVFLVAARHDEVLRAASARVEAAFADEHGVVGPPAWYAARHEMFEQLIAAADFARVVDGDGMSAVAELAVAAGGRKRGAWDAATPAERRELARAAKIADRRLREMVAAALADPAAAEAGLWIETESAMPPEREQEPEAAQDVDPAEVVRRLHAFMQEHDRDPLEDGTSTYHAYLCELTDEDARDAAEVWHGVDPEDTDAVVRAKEDEAARCRRMAVTHVEEANIAAVDALDTLCAKLSVPALARNIYTADQARALLAWLEKQRASVARDLVLPPLRAAVKRRHAFAIVSWAS